MSDVVISRVRICNGVDKMRGRSFLNKCPFLNRTFCDYEAAAQGKWSRRGNMTHDSYFIVVMRSQAHEARDGIWSHSFNRSACVTFLRTLT